MGNVASAFGCDDPDLAENQEIEHTSYGEKLSSAFCGMCIGFVLFWGSLGTAAWNEYNYVANTKTITAAKEEFINVNCSPIVPENEGKLVHVTCPVSGMQVLGQQDPVLQGISAEKRTGLYLSSYMEVFQWTESSSSKTTDDKVGGGSSTVTTYTYSRGWGTSTPTPVTSFFKQGESCKTQNGDNACYNWDPEQVESWFSINDYDLGTHKIDTSTGVKAGDFIIPEDKVSNLGSPTVLTPSCTNGTTGLSCAPGNATLQGTKIVWKQKDSNGAMIDYLTRSYTIYTINTVSILAEQRGNSFVRWTSPYDDSYYIYRFSDGNKTAEEMIEDAEFENTGLVWFLRFLTLLVCIVSLVMITAPLTVMGDVIPCIGPLMGDLIGYALWAVDCLFGCCCWSFVAAIAWIVYRPQVGIPLLIASCCLCAGGGFAAYALKKKKSGQADNAGEKEDVAEIPVAIAEEYIPAENPGYNPDLEKH